MGSDRLSRLRRLRDKYLYEQYIKDCGVLTSWGLHLPKGKDRVLFTDLFQLGSGQRKANRNWPPLAHEANLRRCVSYTTS